MFTSEPTLAELEMALRINEHELEFDCRDQPELFYRVARQVVLLRSRRDAAAQTLKEIEAEADARIRQHAETDEERIREKDVESRVQLDQEVIQARKELLDLKLEVGKMEALKEAFLDRKDRLRDLVQLFIANYYSEADHPATPLRSKVADTAKRQLQARRGAK